MPQVTFTAKNKKNTGLMFNDRELLALFFYGIDIVNKQGTLMDPEVLTFYIEAAQQEVEKFLGIKIAKQIVTERSDYYRNEFQDRGFVRVKYPVKQAVKLDGYLANQILISYPGQWQIANRVNSTATSRQITIVPNSNIADLVLGAVVYGGTVLPYLGLVNSDNIGSYWMAQYITGFDFNDLPMDLLKLIGKLASIPVFDVLGDIALGLPALASYSISIDGLSNSISSTNSATNAAYGARIINYQKEIDLTLKKLTGVYKGVTFTSI